MIQTHFFPFVICFTVCISIIVFSYYLIVPTMVQQRFIQSEILKFSTKMLDAT